MGTPVGLAVSPSGALFYATRSTRCGCSGRGGGAMSRFGRRTFLASSAGVAAGGVRGGRAAGSSGGARRPERRNGPSDRRSRRGRPARCVPAASRSTAWPTRWASTPTTARSPGRCRHGRGVAQTAYRIMVRRADPGQPGSSGTAARWSRPGRPSSPTGARRWRPTPPTLDGPGPGAAALGAGLGAGALHHDAAGRRLAGPVAAPGRRLAATRPGDLSAHGGDAAGRHRRPGHGLRLRRPHLPLFVDGAAVDAWPSFSYPDEQYVRAWT